MKKLNHFTRLVLIGLLLALVNGCSRGVVVKLPDPSSLPGAADVRAAMEKKDYEAAVAGLMKIKEAATTDEQTAQFSVLSSEVRSKLLEAGDKDEKAADALNALRVMTTGGR